MDIETGDEETDGETTTETGTEDEPESDRDVSTPTNETKPSPKKLYHYETLMKGTSVFSFSHNHLPEWAFNYCCSSDR